MPNWCSNVIVITGDKDKIKTILEKLGTIPVNTDHKVFETLIGADTESNGWYESNLKRYGTKWDVSPEDSNIEFSDDIITMSPPTAWSPPVPFCVTLAKEYGVQVEIKFFEPGCDFAGRSVINEQGEIIEEDDYDYNEGLYILDNDGFWNERENDLLSEDDLEGKTLTEYVAQRFSYVDEESRPELVEIFEEILTNDDEDDSGE